MLTMYKMHHLKADIDRLYVKRKEGGRGLVQVDTTYKAEIINIAEYLNANYKEDQFLKIVLNHESTQPNMNSLIKSAANFVEELSQLYGKKAMQNRMKYNTRRHDWERF
jgi:hypothetical protein